MPPLRRKASAVSLAFRGWTRRVEEDIVHREGKGSHREDEMCAFEAVPTVVVEKSAFSKTQNPDFASQRSEAAIKQTKKWYWPIQSADSVSLTLRCTPELQDVP